jgi:glycosyltransferase involved in cell wall biosynthesis
VRVAVFTDNDFEKVNGVTTTLTALLDHAPPDVCPRIYTASALGTDAPNYLALASMAVPIPFYSEMDVYVPHVREYLRRVRVDQVDVLHLTTPGPMGLTAAWIASKTGLPLIGSFHTDLAGYTAVLSGSNALAALMARYLQWLYGRCAPILVPSAATRDLLVGSGTSARRIVLWPRGVDTNHFTPARRSSRLRERWRASERDVVLLYVGRLSREKSLDLLPEMLYRLRASRVPHRMVIAGDGPLRRSLAEQLPDAIFTGMLTRDEVAEVFASADVFVFPSTTDTAGNVVLEAQASGLPVIVSKAGGPREHMCPGVSGMVCEDGDPKRWAAMVARVARDLICRRSMAAAAREYAVRRNWDIALMPVYQAYRDAGRDGLFSVPWPGTRPSSLSGAPSRTGARS